MKDKVNILKEFEEYNYLLDDESWKEELPSFKLYKSEMITLKPKVSAIIANYNNAPYLANMMNSLVEQTLGIHRIQVMFIDDCSTDKSLEVVKPYTGKYPNIEIYHLTKNTGGAHGPRNLGLLNARGEYLVFLDADDWYDVNGLKILSDLLDKSEDGIAFGGVLCSANGRLSHWIPSYIEANRMNYPIDKLPYDFYSWLGPQGNMVRASLIFENNLHFINQRVADDVTFFLQVLRISGKISQTTELTTYLNRDDDNNSLSKSVNETFLLSWLRSLSYLKTSYEMDDSLKKFLARRLEWLVIDFSMRWDTGYGFSKEKVANFADLIGQYLGDLPICLGNYFKTKERKIIWEALIEKNFDFIVKFYEWHSLPFYDKKLELVEGVYYYVSDDPEIPNVEVSVRIEGNTVKIRESKIIIDFNIYGTEEVNYCELRNINNPWDSKIIDVTKLDDIHHKVIIPHEIFEEIENDEPYKVFIRTNRFHDNPILINEIECLVQYDTVIRNINGHVAIEKRGVEKGNYLVVNESSEEVVVESRNKSANLSCVNVVGSSFLSNGKFAMLTDEGVRINMDSRNIRKISDKFNKQERNKIEKKFNTQLCLYKSEEELLIYKTPSKQKREVYDYLINKGETFDVSNIIITEDSKEVEIFFEIAPHKFILADKKLANKIDYLEDYLDKHSVITDRGNHQTGVNFIVMTDKLPIYKAKELGEDNLTNNVLTRGDMFKVKSFSHAHAKESSLEIEGVGFVSAKRELTEKMNDKLNHQIYNVKLGKYIVIGKEEKGYRSPSFANRLRARGYKKGTIVNGVGFGISAHGYPRLKLDDGNYVTSNVKYIKFEGE